MSDQPIALSSPKLRVIFGDAERSETWEAIEVQTTGRDMQQAEELLARNGMGKLVDVPINGTVAAAYYAMRRTGKRGGDWAQFQNEYIDIAPVEDPQDVIFPTQTEARNGRSQP